MMITSQEQIKLIPRPQVPHDLHRGLADPFPLEANEDVDLGREFTAQTARFGVVGVEDGEEGAVREDKGVRLFAGVEFRGVARDVLG